MRNIEVITFLPNTDLYQKHIANFLNLMEIAANGGDRLHSNYKVCNLHLPEQSAFSLGYQDGIPFMSATIWQRSCFPKNTVRIMNRFFKKSDTRDLHFSKRISDGIVEMVKQQVQACKIFGYDYAFMSRKQTHRRSLIMVTSNLTKKLGFQWVVPSEQFLVCPNPRNDDCWQLVAYTPLSEAKREFNLTRKSP